MGDPYDLQCISVLNAVFFASITEFIYCAFYSPSKNMGNKPSSSPRDSRTSSFSSPQNASHSSVSTPSYSNPTSPEKKVTEGAKIQKQLAKCEGKI
jgi:hypothetical protein